mmetsp:Transcript_18644/g.45036  ORF Transcript_18644/g.45036 Transcript_18644/m.45036 type:complete len:293 (-) Transcript_18644:92-970(-)|eukprot:CAMPEP_0113445822 /NCGR_PEP_ID=MMETSP0014_2-20120614/3386_1 /TAXON_ID=2857 /ORGANISM="Nitzschia sp." /LENGTH=292 /DNA_ID=CAMNT_0000336889 /DNA_START=104 /DNA_END=982 /DNA_ORIENTATION=- /assembly_acc=CAM_ASM_000159
MSEPDELYTLRAQFWLGHYQMALDEGKSIARRPMSPELKAEREELVARCYIALKDYDKVVGGDTPALQALAIQAQFESMVNVKGSEAQTQGLVQQLQSMLGDPSPSVHLTAAYVLLQAGMKKEALQCVHQGTTLEHTAVCVQIYIMIDRLDLATQTLAQMRRQDEDSMLTQVTSVHVALATGSSAASEAVHTLNQLSEQYGPSPFLLNLTACAYLQAGNYVEASSKLEQAREEFQAADVDTLVNSIVALQYQDKPTDELVGQLKTQYPNHFLSQGLETVQGAFDRESIKYRV